MRIITKSKVSEVDSKREVAPLSARKRLKSEFTWREKVLAGEDAASVDPTGTRPGKYTPLKNVQDPGEMARQARDYRKNYERTMPIKLDPQTKNAMWKEAKRLKDKFAVGMVPKDELHPVKHKEIIKNGKLVTAVVVDKNKIKETNALERNQAWVKRNENNVREFKRIMRSLEPENPKITDVERFRPKTQKKKNGGK